MATQTIGRNDICPCGSGRKFKRCCLQHGWTARLNRVFPAPPNRQGDAGRRRHAQSLPTITTPEKERDWKQVHVVVDKSDGKQVFAVLLHSSEWLRLHDVATGATIHLSLQMHGVEGEGLVRLIEPSPMRSDAEGRVMTFVEHFGKKKGSTKKAPTTSSTSCPGLRTYFGERLPPVGHEWVRMEIDTGAGKKADLTLTRSAEWMRANWDAVEKLRNDEESPADIGQWRVLRFSVEFDSAKRLQLAAFWKLSWVKASGLSIDEPVYLRLPEKKLYGDGRLVGIDAAPFVPRQGEPKGLMFISGERRSEGVFIESIQVGDYMTTYTDEERGVVSPPEDAESEMVVRQRIHLRLEKEDGGDVALVLLRSTEWVQTEGVEAGKIHLDLPEQGTMGWADVQSVTPCLVFRHSGNAGARMVTGTFRHSDGWAGDLKLNDNHTPIGVTEGHLFWSVDRQDWIAAGELRVGETLKTLEGTTTVVSYTMRDHFEPVYNLEVEVDHCFRLGDQGVLVHNTSSPCGNDPCSQKNLSPNAILIQHTNVSGLLDRRRSATDFLCRSSNPMVTTQAIVYRALALLGNLTGGSVALAQASAWARCVIGKMDDAPGHVIGNRLGGTGQVPPAIPETRLNIFPQNRAVNNSQMKSRELTIRNWVTSHPNDRVCIEVILDYKDSIASGFPARPTQVIYNVWINGVLNPPPFNVGSPIPNP